MIWHTVVFQWKDEATADQKQLAETLIAKLPSLVPSVREFRFGSDIGINEGNFDFVVSASFDDLPGYLAYRDNPDHRAMIQDHILPIAATRAAVQFEA